MSDPIDLLQVKIERAREKLPPEAVRAIDAVDWKKVIFDMRQKKGYSFDQLQSLELETELILCGLSSPTGYPKALEEQMKISRTQAEALVNEMNELIFKKIREELIRNSKSSKGDTVEQKAENLSESRILDQAGINILAKKEDIVPAVPTEQREEMLAKIETPPPTEQPINGISGQKLSGSFQNKGTKTEYTLDNMSKSSDTSVHTAPSVKSDPYRMPIE